MNPKLKSYLIHSSLFIVTFITTTLAGAEWTYGKSIFFTENYSWADFASGLPYSICFLMILTCHEFGHYFTAVYYRVKTTLPYYIPLPPFGFLLGTLGALIRIKQPIQTNRQQFDIGIAGPLAGLVVALGFLIYGFMTLPPPDYIFQFHPEYQKYGLDYAKHVYDPSTMPENTVDVIIGKNMLFVFLEKTFADPSRMPNPHEIMHYPFLFAGFLSLLFTGLNLLPIGQLDGGHVLYGLVGYRWHKIIATIVFFTILFITGLGYIEPNWPIEKIAWQGGLYLLFLFMAMRSIFEKRSDRLMYALIIFTTQYITSWLLPTVHGYSGWFLFTMLIGFFVGVPHPPSAIEQPLDTSRKILGWFALLVFFLCLTPDPISLIAPTTATP
ncbi:MAG: site-2 protease family protein [Bacteroidetes bacterium]|nr:site-2 protease family protein [Bacteroidota bacterium]